MPKYIIILSDGKILEAWGSLKKLCSLKGYPYHRLARLKFPFTYKEICFYKLKYKEEIGVGNLNKNKP